MFMRYEQADGKRKGFGRGILMGLMLAAMAGMAAGGAYQVKDLKPATTHQESSAPGGFYTYNNRTWFWADDGLHGRELWRTDGTAAGTRMVLDLYPGRLSGSDIDREWGGSGGRLVTGMNGIVYFCARDGRHGVELWRSDGTTKGTWMVKDLNPGMNGSNPSESVIYKNKLFFRASTTPNGGELWCTDGTAPGTVMIKDFLPGRSTDGSMECAPQVVGGLLYIATMTETFDYALWKTDGTTQGTVKVYDFMRGPQGWEYCSLKAVAELNGEIFFYAAEGRSSRSELWKSNGTTGGTKRMRMSQKTPGGLWGYIIDPWMTRCGDQIFYMDDDGLHGCELWRTDGTEQGTRMIKDLEPGERGIFTLRGNMLMLGPWFAKLGNKLFFTSGNYELCYTDGTANGTAKLKPLWGTPAEDYYVCGPTVFKDRVYFLVQDNQYHNELWKTDGTAQGTVRVRSEGQPVQKSGSVYAGLNGQGFFVKIDEECGSELWVTNGTDNGTMLFKDINVCGSSDPLSLTDLDGRLIFGANDGAHGWEPYVSDGTAKGTFLLRDIVAGERSAILPTDDLDDTDGLMFSKVGRKLFFLGASEDFMTMNPWQTNGSVAGTTRIASIDAGRSSFSLNGAVLKDKLFFVGRNDAAGSELWVSNGTSAGTQMVKDIIPGGESSEPYGLTEVQGRLFFTVSPIYDEANPASPGFWISDGTAKGTKKISAIGVHYFKRCNPNSNWPWSGKPFVNSDQGAFFLGYDVNDTTHGEMLWHSDGTTSGTKMVADLPEIDPYEDYMNQRLSLEAQFANGRLIFTLADVAHGPELWVSDGTEKGTGLLKDIWPGAVGSYPMNLTRVGRWVYFHADDGTHGRELWRSDGTAAGTVMVKDIVAGKRGSLPTGFAAVGDTGVMVFSAWSAANGVELWRTDGTAQGTRLANDILPGTDSSSPRYFTVSGTRLYFSACGGGSRGTELWAMPLADVMNQNASRNWTLYQ